MVLFGRSAERERLGRLSALAAEGLSGSLVLRGEPRAGKTALLDDAGAAATTAGLRTARLTGVESETQLGYAALHQYGPPEANCRGNGGDDERDTARCGAEQSPPGDEAKAKSRRGPVTTCLSVS